mmetsp:Transcript_28665/g.69443  ORF Transcript_28665/g.69443 Transcript_28665/m.69443 type:complete len:111 (-) Transcript_28665:41-373(-)
MVVVASQELNTMVHRMEDWQIVVVIEILLICWLDETSETKGDYLGTFLDFGPTVVAVSVARKKSQFGGFFSFRTHSHSQSVNKLCTVNSITKLLVHFIFYISWIYTWCSP